MAGPDPMVRALAVALALLSACAPPAPGPDTFPPEKQEPLFERGLIAAPSSIPCVPVTTARS